MGRQHRNEDRIACHGAVEVNKSQYDFVALVEHLPSGRLNVEGHFVTWVKQGEKWLRCDDAVVTEERCLADTVEKGVVLALYTKSSSHCPGTGGVTTAAPERRSVEKARGRKQVAFARQGRVRTLPFAAAGDGTMEFEQDVAACLRTFENSGEVEAFLGELPPYSVGSLDGKVAECPTFIVLAGAFRVCVLPGSGRDLGNIARSGKGAIADSRLRKR